MLPVDVDQGVHGHGSNQFTARELAAVRAHICQVPQHAPETVAAIAQSLGWTDGRLVRAILSWLDGREVLLGGHNKGYFCCEAADQGDQLTAALVSQFTRMQERIERRRSFAAGLPRWQGRLL